MITICKSWTFEAAHRLARLPSTHKCHHMHGHTYRVEVELSATTYAVETILNGMVVDYDALDEWVQPILRLVDHKVLNEVRGIGDMPTTENLVIWFWNRFAEIFGVDVNAVTLEAVRVYESSTTWAEFRPQRSPL